MLSIEEIVRLAARANKLTGPSTPRRNFDREFSGLASADQLLVTAAAMVMKGETFKRTIGNHAATVKSRAQSLAEYLGASFEANAVDDPRATEVVLSPRRSQT
jgi:hypothetical protein